MLYAVAAIIGFIGILYVAAPIFNTAVTVGQPTYNATNGTVGFLGTCLTNCGSSNLTGYTGAIGISQASFIIIILGILAIAAWLAISMFGLNNKG